MTTRATLTIKNEDKNVTTGVNLGELRKDLPKSLALYRATSEHRIRFLNRVYGPKTAFLATEVEYKNDSYVVTGFPIKPLHGKENDFETLETKPITLKFSL
jgi:hypothetical protein